MSLGHAEFGVYLVGFRVSEEFRVCRFLLLRS